MHPWVHKLVKIDQKKAPGAVPGAIGGDLGSQDGPRGIRKPRIRIPVLEPKSGLGPAFGGLVLYFFGVLVFPIFYSFACPNLPFRFIFWALLWELWAYGKTVESVVVLVNFKGLTPSIRSPFAVLDWGCISMMIFCRFSWFLVVLGPGSELFRDRSVLKRRSEIQCNKNDWKGERE